MNTKEFFKRWGEGIKQSTPSQMLVAKRWGHIGMIAGIILAYSFMAQRGLWYFILFFAAMIFLQVLDIINVNKQLVQTRMIDDQLAGGNNGRDNNNEGNKEKDSGQ